MLPRVAIVGIGWTPLRPLSPDVSFREMIFEAAVRAYADAGIEPGEVDTFMSVSEDYLEGTAIADEYVPDQLGAVRKPVHTIAADGITALGSAVMQLQTGRFGIAVVEGRSKASNILHPAHIEAFALDPVFARPLDVNPIFVAGMEMRAFLGATANTVEQAGRVVVKNRLNALGNPSAAYPARLSLDEVMASVFLAEPLKASEVSQQADGAVVLVVARADVASRLSAQPVYVRGIGWMQDTPNLESRAWSKARYAEGAAQMAYRMAEIGDPAGEIDLAVVDDTFSYKELQHLESLGLAPEGRAGKLLEEGAFDLAGALPVNPSGGSLGCGYTYDMSGLRAVLEIVRQLRGQAGAYQVQGAKVGLAQSWRGIPTASGGVVLLGS